MNELLPRRDATFWERLGLKLRSMSGTKDDRSCVGIAKRYVLLCRLLVLYMYDNWNILGDSKLKGALVDTVARI